MRLEALTSGLMPSSANADLVPPSPADERPAPHMPEGKMPPSSEAPNTEPSRPPTPGEAATAHGNMDFTDQDEYGQTVQEQYEDAHPSYEPIQPDVQDSKCSQEATTFLLSEEESSIGEEVFGGKEFASAGHEGLEEEEEEEDGSSLEVGGELLDAQGRPMLFVREESQARLQRGVAGAGAMGEVWKGVAASRQGEVERLSLQIHKLVYKLNKAKQNKFTLLRKITEGELITKTQHEEKMKELRLSNRYELAEQETRLLLAEEKLKLDINVMKGTIKELETTIEGKEKNIDELSLRLAEADGSIPILRLSIQEQNNQIDSLKKELELDQKRISDQKRSLVMLTTMLEEEKSLCNQYHMDAEKAKNTLEIKTEEIAKVLSTVDSEKLALKKETESERRQKRMLIKKQEETQKALNNLKQRFLGFGDTVEGLVGYTELTQDKISKLAADRRAALAALRAAAGAAREERRRQADLKEKELLYEGQGGAPPPPTPGGGGGAASPRRPPRTPTSLGGGGGGGPWGPGSPGGSSLRRSGTAASARGSARSGAVGLLGAALPRAGTGRGTASSLLSNTGADGAYYRNVYSEIAGLDSGYEPELFKSSVLMFAPKEATDAHKASFGEFQEEVTQFSTFLSAASSGSPSKSKQKDKPLLQKANFDIEKASEILERAAAVREICRTAVRGLRGETAAERARVRFETQLRSAGDEYARLERWWRARAEALLQEEEARYLSLDKINGELQKKIQNLKLINANTEQRYENLEKKHTVVEEENKRIILDKVRIKQDLTQATNLIEEQRVTLVANLTKLNEDVLAQLEFNLAKKDTQLLDVASLMNAIREQVPDPQDGYSELAGTVNVMISTVTEISQILGNLLDGTGNLERENRELRARCLRGDEHLWSALRELEAEEARRAGLRDAASQIDCDLNAFTRAIQTQVTWLAESPALVGGDKQRRAPARTTPLTSPLAGPLATGQLVPGRGTGESIGVGAPLAGEEEMTDDRSGLRGVGGGNVMESESGCFGNEAKAQVPERSLLISAGSFEEPLPGERLEEGLEHQQQHTIPAWRPTQKARGGTADEIKNGGNMEYKASPEEEENARKRLLKQNNSAQQMVLINNLLTPTSHQKVGSSLGQIRSSPSAPGAPGVLQGSAAHNLASGALAAAGGGGGGSGAAAALAVLQQRRQAPKRAEAKSGRRPRARTVEGGDDKRITEAKNEQLPGSASHTSTAMGKTHSESSGRNNPTLNNLREFLLREGSSEKIIGIGSGGSGQSLVSAKLEEEVVDPVSGYRHVSPSSSLCNNQHALAKEIVTNREINNDRINQSPKVGGGREENASLITPEDDIHQQVHQQQSTKSLNGANDIIASCMNDTIGKKGNNANMVETTISLAEYAQHTREEERRVPAKNKENATATADEQCSTKIKEEDDEGIMFTDKTLQQDGSGSLEEDTTIDFKDMSKPFIPWKLRLGFTEFSVEEKQEEINGEIRAWSNDDLH